MRKLTILCLLAASAGCGTESTTPANKPSHRGKQIGRHGTAGNAPHRHGDRFQSTGKTGSRASHAAPAAAGNPVRAGNSGGRIPGRRDIS